MLRKIYAFATGVALTFTCYSQNETEVTSEAPKKTTITGSVDFYYRYNFSNPRKEFDFLNNYTSFTNSQNSFEIGMASVKLEQTIGKVGFVADVGFGKRAEEFAYADENTRFALKQAFVTYAPIEPLKFTAGSWATHIGYEVLDPFGNRNYSMSYMFSYGPFSHTGMKADLTLGSSGIMVGIANPTDLRSANFARKNLIAQYSFVTADEKFKTFLNYQHGKPSDSLKYQQVDLTTNTILSDQFSVGFNGTVSSSKYMVNGKFDQLGRWWGSALYLNFDPSSQVGFTIRGEYFDDEKSVSGGAFGAHIFATTLSANLKIGDLIIIPEIRNDRASADLFMDKDGTMIRSTTSALLAAVYKF